jgi:Polyketide cyclase / dehydrase and lipid transport
MSYLASVSVEFPQPSRVVYDALCALGHYPEWSAGMSSISYQGRMHPGLTYQTTVDVLGKENQSTIKVLDMVPDQAIVLQSIGGLIKFVAEFNIQTTPAKGCTVTCRVHLEFSRALFNLAQPLAEAIAENRIRNDLETLRDRLAGLNASRQ